MSSFLPSFFPQLTSSTLATARPPTRPPAPARPSPLSHTFRQQILTGVVFHHRPATGRYSLTFAEAQMACQSAGAVIASPLQLRAAFEKGLHRCDAGWLSDQTVGYPIVTPSYACNGNASLLPGVRSYGLLPASKQYDVFCFVERQQGEVFFISDYDGFSYEEAVQQCQKLKSTLATTGQLFYAWNQGFDMCRPGWLLDRSVRYPVTTSRSNCAGGRVGVHIIYAYKNKTGFPDEHSRYDAYCFRAGAPEVHLEKKPSENLTIVPVDVINETTVTVDYFAPTAGVFYYQPPTGRYTLNFTEAQMACQSVGTVMASLSQLLAAQQKGMNQCYAGWLSDQTVRNPVGASGNWCNLRWYAAIRSYGHRPLSEKHNVFCYEEPGMRHKFSGTSDQSSHSSGSGEISRFGQSGVGEENQESREEPTGYAVTPDAAYTSPTTAPPTSLVTPAVVEQPRVVKAGVFHYQPPTGRYTLTFMQAKIACQTIGTVIASLSQLLAAQQKGLHQCNFGWLSDRTVRFPVSAFSDRCNRRQHTGIRSYGHRPLNEKYDVFCYEEPGMHHEFSGTSDQSSHSSGSGEISSKPAPKATGDPNRTSGKKAKPKW